MLDYFSNHRLKLRFPWSLYHAPIVQALQQVVSESPGPALLNIGSGPFFELDLLKLGSKRFTLCDIDERAIALAKQRYGARLAGADVTNPNAGLPYADGSFDTVVSMDVIEHVLDPVPWLLEARRVLKPNGVLFLTTPNYGSTSLRVIEATALEAIARLQNFSRKHIHPTKMDVVRLASVLRSAGFHAPRVESMAFDWVLAAYGSKA
ncbi:MAG TPA: class I SAM-dependent methyltransferase [Polyangiaceae bacterium]|nr:class I SAM-dependent methyltransferase [Polyangiaceae bacterium]